MIIDICNNCAAAGCLKQYYISKKIINHKIIYMNLNLSIGDIKNDHISIIKNIYGENFFDYNNSIKELLHNIENNKKIIIWSSKNNAEDYLLLLYLCNILKNKVNNISVIFTTDYDKNLSNINCLDYKKIDSIIKYEKNLTFNDLNKYSNNWKNLVEINSDLRVMENGIIRNKSYNDYDDIILNTLDSLGNCTLSNLVEILMTNFVIGDNSIIYQYLIERLIFQNKIKILTKGNSHLLDIIEIKK